MPNNGDFVAFCDMLTIHNYCIRRKRESCQNPSTKISRLLMYIKIKSKTSLVTLGCCRYVVNIFVDACQNINAT